VAAVAAVGVAALARTLRRVEVTGGSMAPALLEEARRELAREIATLGAPAGRVRECVVPGPAPRALLRCAADEAADLLVVGVHPHVLGSTTHPVVRGADCPVLTVPAEAGGRELP